MIPGGDGQIAGIKRQILGAGKIDLHAFRVRSRGNGEVVFEFALIAVIGKVNSGIHILVNGAGILGDIAAPF